jgi:putative Ca2+/H+ antiporter (TMEM165/GDT1 family)
MAAALAFMVMGAFVAREATKARKTHPRGALHANPGSDATVCESSKGWDWRAFSSTFGLLFVAELGDKTQLAVLSLSGKNGAVWEVFAGGALALTLVTAIGAAGGQALSQLIPQRAIRWASALAFLAMGTLIATGLL